MRKHSQIFTSEYIFLVAPNHRWRTRNAGSFCMPAGDKYENGVNFQTNPILGHLTHIKELDGFRMLRLDC